jgi:hypothetical protein
MPLKAGSRLKSAVCETEVIAVRAPGVDVDLRCGGAPMIEFEADAPSGGAISPDHHAGTQLGKRYADETTGIELLCTKPGEGSLSVGDVPLPLKEAKPLPASD